MSRAGRNNHRHEAGFTLLEVLVVLVILSLAAFAVHTSAKRQTHSAALKSTAVAFASRMRVARSQAIHSGRARTVVVDLDRRQIAADAGLQAVRIPGHVAAQVFAAASQQRSRRVSGIRFFPNGRSTGGRIRLAYGGQSYEVRVNWLTGRTSLVGAR